MAPERGTTHFLLRTVAPICIAAFIAITLGLVVTAYTGGLLALVITITLVVSGGWIGWQRGDDFAECVEKAKKSRKR